MLKAIGIVGCVDVQWLIIPDFPAVTLKALSELQMRSCGVQVCTAVMEGSQLQ